VIDPLELSLTILLNKKCDKHPIERDKNGIWYLPLLPVCGKTSYGDRRGMSGEFFIAEGTSCEDSVILSNTFLCHK